MDNQFYNQPNQQFNGQHLPPSKRSVGMEAAALTLGVIALSTSCCIYASIVCGALGIMFALLSRGGEMQLSQRAKTGLILSIIGLVATIAFTTYSFYIALQFYGSFENLLRASCEMSGLDYDAVFGSYQMLPGLYFF